jgi:hypothetical protein
VAADHGDTPPVSWTSADIQTLKQAILDRQFADEIQFSDQRIRFMSVDDALKLLAVMEAQVNPSRTRFAATSKGL